MSGSLNFYSPAKKKARPEARLQKAVVQIAQLQALPGVMWHSVPNERKCSAILGAELKAMGLRPGVGDTIWIIRGYAHYLELKALGEKLSDEQVKFRDECSMMGIPYAVCDNIKDALAQLVLWGAIRAVRIAA
jgi:hypothetical protein